MSTSMVATLPCQLCRTPVTAMSVMRWIGICSWTLSLSGLSSRVPPIACGTLVFPWITRVPSPASSVSVPVAKKVAVPPTGRLRPASISLPRQAPKQGMAGVQLPPAEVPQPHAASSMASVSPSGRLARKRPLLVAIGPLLVTVQVMLTPAPGTTVFVPLSHGCVVWPSTVTDRSEIAGALALQSMSSDQSCSWPLLPATRSSMVNVHRPLALAPSLPVVRRPTNSDSALAGATSPDNAGWLSGTPQLVCASRLAPSSKLARMSARAQLPVPEVVDAAGRLSRVTMPSLPPRNTWPLGSVSLIRRSPMKSCSISTPTRTPCTKLQLPPLTKLMLLLTEPWSGITAEQLLLRPPALQRAPGRAGALAVITKSAR